MSAESLPPAYEKAKLAHLLSRAICGCLSADCPRHGAYVAGERDEAYELAARHAHAVPELILVDGRLPQWHDYEKVVRDNPIVKQADEALRLGGYQDRTHMLQCVVIALDQVNGRLLDQLFARGSGSPSLAVPYGPADQFYRLTWLAALIVNGHPGVNTITGWELQYAESTWLRLCVSSILAWRERYGLNCSQLDADRTFTMFLERKYAEQQTTLEQAHREAQADSGVAGHEPDDGYTAESPAELTPETIQQLAEFRTVSPHELRPPRFGEDVQTAIDCFDVEALYPALDPAEIDAAELDSEF
jgi:hypothetical protein